MAQMDRVQWHASPLMVQPGVWIAQSSNTAKVNVDDVVSKHEHGAFLGVSALAGPDISDPAMLEGHCLS
jgi:hypothetical protein